MKKLTSSIVDSVTEGVKSVRGLVDNNVTLAWGHVGNLPLVSSLLTPDKPYSGAYDERHYFLIPFRLAGQGYTLYSTRRVPGGCSYSINCRFKPNFQYLRIKV